MASKRSSLKIQVARDLPLAGEGVEAVITSRLFMILDRKQDAIDHNSDSNPLNNWAGIPPNIFDI
ncbi:MAG: hypothetical protein JOY96_04925 [Verrucomicrobia bacterium]|nr:hypothetical protein [Verrucomicrobiota bacterium]